MKLHAPRHASLHVCPSCDLILSIPEIIERFCERCTETIVPREVREPVGEFRARFK